MAYYEGPETYHASYGVLVRHKNINNLNQLDEFEEANFAQLSALIRINETVSKVFKLLMYLSCIHIISFIFFFKKEVIICYVMYENNNDNNQIDLKNVECLKYFKILEVLINRWVPGSDNKNESYKQQQQIISNELLNND